MDDEKYTVYCSSGASKKVWLAAVSGSFAALHRLPHLMYSATSGRSFSAAVAPKLALMASMDSDKAWPHIVEAPTTCSRLSSSSGSVTEHAAQALRAPRNASSASASAAPPSGPPKAGSAPRELAQLSQAGQGSSASAQRLLAKSWPCWVLSPWLDHTASTASGDSPCSAAMCSSTASRASMLMFPSFMTQARVRAVRGAPLSSPPPLSSLPAEAGPSEGDGVVAVRQGLLLPWWAGGPSAEWTVASRLRMSPQAPRKMRGLFTPLGRSPPVTS